MFARIARFHRDRQLKAAFEKHQRLLVPGLLLLGFLVDVLTFRSLQMRTMFVLLGVHAVVATACIVLRGRSRFVAPVLLQFSFGALLSSSLLFYWFSGALSASWPIMALLILLMASNEVFRHVFLRPDVQIGVYAFVLISYFTALFPFMFRSIGPWMFVLGGASGVMVALALVGFIAWRFATPKDEWRAHILVILSVFAIFSVLYFTNAIPPVPLSIREAGIYHDVRRMGAAYALTGDDETSLERLWPGQTIRADGDGRIYAYAAIFAPTELETDIHHRWQWHDPSTETWIDSGRFSYGIRGGREEGYRGYTFKTGLAPGKWRVIVETARGQELGRIPFTLEE